MKVLISAIACHPTLGSEAFVGWQAVSALQEDHELWVMTDIGAKEAIEKVQEGDPNWRRVSFHYVGTPHTWHHNRMIARLESWMLYRDWCKQAEIAARQLHQEIGFDLAHHVTYATWRMGSPLAGLGIPWIWGPIGGGERFPWSLFNSLSPAAAGFEIVRQLNTWISSYSRNVKRAVNNATVVVVNNPDTERLLLYLGAPAERIERLTQSFLSQKRLRTLLPENKKSPSESGSLRIIAGGNLEGRKGVSIALHGLALARSHGIPFEYIYLGYGPERDYLISLSHKLGLTGNVTFLEALRGEDYVKMLRSAHIYLLLSLREGVPITQIEAMAAGCVPVVADCGGAGPMASLAGAGPIPVSSQDLMAEEVAEKLIGYCDNEETWRSLSKNSSGSIKKYYSDINYKTNINAMYNLVYTSSKTFDHTIN